ncbi:hypothetical protein GGX14DRAFT_558350 [Mycena pura]|uniref:Uncharacterized protein n=1 Tax=Mycena pura TaxID=153505 RepID=A0AAD6VVW8_9AGAR|nr:hypothetical protein GGX14DRAFT_558350 [Mycena pura]
MPTLLEIGRRKREAAAAAARSQRPEFNSNPTSPSSEGFGGGDLAGQVNLPPSSPGRPRSSSIGPGELDDLPTVSQVITSVSQSNRVPDMTTFGERQLKRIKLATGSERDYHLICATTNPHERQNLEALAVFQLLDKVDEMNGLLKAAKAQEYERNSEVSAEIRNFSRAFLLNPELAFYSADSTLKVNVVEAMYKEGITGLPPTNSSNAVKKKFESVIGHQLSVDRNKIKDTLAATLDPDAEIKDLATVTSGIIASWRVDVPLTLPLLWRMGLVRYQLLEEPGTPDDFWEGIDTGLHTCRQDAPGTLIYALQDTFKADIERFGNIPAEIELDPDIGPHSPTWIQRVNKMAPKVDCPKIVNPKGKKTAKRKRAATDIENRADGPANDV